MAETVSRRLDWTDLAGWEADDHEAALAAFLVTSDLIVPEGYALSAEARAHHGQARAFFERAFRPALFTDGNVPLFTGYYEPELAGTRTRSDDFQHPIYRPPADLRTDRPWHSRAEIETGRHLEGRGLEIAWLSDPLEAFLLQVQGSGRIRLDDGTVVRVGYAARNGHPYRSIGAELVRRGICREDAMTADVLRNWFDAHPDEGAALLHDNPSFVFFREVDVPTDSGPIGAMGRPVTPLRSVAVDPDIVPLGLPVWVETSGAHPVRRLLVAQDTGGAIRGAQRADIFVGTGAEAGRIAGRMRDAGRMVVLCPADRPGRPAAGF